MTAGTLLIPAQENHRQRIVLTGKLILALADMIWNAVYASDTVLESYRVRIRCCVYAIGAVIYRPVAIHKHCMVCANEHRNHVPSRDVE